MLVDCQRCNRLHQFRFHYWNENGLQKMCDGGEIVVEKLKRLKKNLQSKPIDTSFKWRYLLCFHKFNEPVRLESRQRSLLVGDQKEVVTGRQCKKCGMWEIKREWLTIF